MSMYVGVSGLKAATTDLNTTSQNIANASTYGFKTGRAEFGDLVDQNAAMGGGMGVTAQAVNQMFGQGSIIQTNNASSSQLDLAITGNGFFQVQAVDSAGAPVTGAPLLYTRAGSFHVDKNGVIVNNIGQALLDGTATTGAGTPLTFTMPMVDPITYDAGTGTFYDSSSPPVAASGALNTVNFPSTQDLKQISDTEWMETTASGAPVAGIPGTTGLGDLKVGFLENSNVDLTDQLVNMIIAQRNFQANSKTITTNNTLTETITNMIR